jgi:hypothetical protein
MIVLQGRKAVICGKKNGCFRAKNQIKVIVAKKRPKCPEKHCFRQKNSHIHKLANWQGYIYIPCQFANRYGGSFSPFLPGFLK